MNNTNKTIYLYKNRTLATVSSYNPHELYLLGPKTNVEHLVQHLQLIDVNLDMMGLDPLMCDPKDEVLSSDPEDALVKPPLETQFLKVQSVPEINESTIHQQIDNYDYTKDSDITDDQVLQVKNMLHRMVRAFALNPSQPGRTNLVTHTIDTGDHPPLRQKPYRQSQIELQKCKEKVLKMLKNRIIRLSRFSWASPVVMVLKPDGSIRFCVDYRKLNKITKKDVYPLPRIEDIFMTLSGCNIFSVFDLASGYWQVLMNEKDIEKTAFITPFGLYEWLVMPMGLTNSPATFQRLMDFVVSGLDIDGVVKDYLMIFQSEVRYLNNISMMLRNFYDV